MNSESATIVKVVTILTSFIIIIGAYFLLTVPAADKKKYSEKTTENTIDIGGEVELRNLTGIDENTAIYKGRYRLVYFGFTYCPDICPHALNIMSETIKILDQYRIDIVPIFITIDPHRDTEKLLGPYLSHFHKKIIGYTGTEEQIKNAADKFKVYYAKVVRSDAGPEDYLLDHSSFFYFLDTEGKYIKHFSSTASPEEIANSINISIKSFKLPQ